MKTLEQICADNNAMDKFVKRIRPVSKAGAARLRKYRKLVKDYMAQGFLCEACSNFTGKKQNTATEVHHPFGRVGSLLNDTDKWILLCRDCHDFVHRYPAKARALGLLAPVGQFNSTPRTQHRRRE